MKKTIFLLAVCLGVSIANAQDKNYSGIPETVKSAFSQRYPTAQKIKWEKEKDVFEAEFVLDKTEQSATFDKNGRLLENEVEISITALPKSITDYVRAHYKTKIKEAAKITDADGKVTYETAIKDKDLIFDAEGKFLKEVK